MTTDQLSAPQDADLPAHLPQSSGSGCPGAGTRAGRTRAVDRDLAAVNDRLRGAVADLEQAREMLVTLTSVAAAGGGGQAIAEALHTMTGFTVAVEDQFGNALALASPDLPQPSPRTASPVRAELLAEIGRCSGPLRDHDRLITPVRGCDGVLGVLALFDPDRRAGRKEILALEHAAVMLAIDLAHRRDLARAELRLGGDLVGDLLTGTHTESALARAAALGHDLRGPHQVLVVRWPGNRDEQCVVEALERAARRCQVDALVARRSGVVMVAALPDSWGARPRWPELHRSLSQILPGMGGDIGVGGVRQSPSDLPHSYTEALHALAIRRRSPEGGVTCFDELGVLRLLFAGDDDSEVDQFVRDWLGVLIDYDEAKGAELVSTLSQYYDHAGNYDGTAAALGIHRSTLRYRLTRIRELTGRDLGAVDCRLNLQVATRAWQILSNGPPTPAK
jgi:sugar diacid utilization regulator